MCIQNDFFNAHFYFIINKRLPFLKCDASKYYNQIRAHLCHMFFTQMNSAQRKMWEVKLMEF